MECPICNNDKNNSSYIVKEMQQGLREEFEYIECSKCGCLFIKNVPEDMGKYYDINYGSHVHKVTLKNRITDKIYSLYIANNKLIKLIQGDNVTITTKFWNNLTSKGIMTKNSSILDVGCGDGKFLSILKKGYDFSIDLFIDDENKQKGITILKTSLEDFKPKKKYDVIISNHALEHMDNQLKNLKCFKNLVKKDGIIVIRIPIKTKPVWDKYGVNWFQIDAPRHFFLHTVESFKILCDKSNLVIENMIFDSEDYIFINCEKYLRNISVRDKEWDTIEFDNETIKQLRNEIRILNKNNESDQAIFLLKIK